MTIQELITLIKQSYSGIDRFTQLPIDDATTRDQVLYGSTEQTCTGIVTTIWASSEVIQKAHELGANLIICHEALFWNHGDHQDWLEDLQIETFLEKKQLLDDYGITVWRHHDYAHSGRLINGQDTDAIFYGLAKILGWQDKIIGDTSLPLLYEIPELTAQELAEHLMDKLNLTGVRLIGNRNTRVKKVKIPMHVFGDANEDIRQIEQEGIDAILPMEMVDFSLAEYIKDASLLGKNKVAICIGHFNLEEAGMAAMVDDLREITKQAIPVHFVPAGDTYDYLVKTN